ncbi:MAG: PEP-CTERM sorting domain-containing protein [Verrucomicrobiota bacterium]
MKYTLKSMRTLVVTLIVVGSLSKIANATIVNIDFEFFDSESNLIGTGFYSFEEIAPNTPTSFNSLASFTWEFLIPSLAIDISSANSDTPSTDSLSQEGVVLTGTEGSRTLQFFDNSGTFILHRDNSETLLSAIQFTEFSSSTDYFDNGVNFGSGSFTAIEAIPEPSSALLIGLGVGTISLMRRRIDKSNVKH